MTNDKPIDPTTDAEERTPEPRMDVINHTGESVCTFLNGAGLHPNEAFIMLLTVFGAVAQAASPSLLDQLQMRIRFASALLDVGHNQVTTVDRAPAPKTPQ